MLDFGIVLKQITKACQNLDCTPKRKKEVIQFFTFYYKEYQNYFNCEHPRLTTDTIQEIISKYDCDDIHWYSIEDYEVIVPVYFETYFECCDYSIVHFMSGNIRQMRMYELM